MCKKTREIFMYILGILYLYKAYNFLRNKLFTPVFYDVFWSKGKSSICIIAPYYSKSGFADVVCIFSYDTKTFAVNAVLVDDPDRNCLIVTFPLPAEMAGNFKYKIARKTKIMFSGKGSFSEETKRYSLSIATLFKYEVQYLKEWIDFHVKSGVEHFYLYENNREPNKEISLVLEPYIRDGLVTHILWPYPYRFYNYRLRNMWPNDAHSYTQLTQINHAVYKFSSDTQWLLCGDVDEYFYSPNTGKVIDAIHLISKLEDISTINISGIWFGGSVNDLEKLRTEGVLKTFLYSETTPTSKGKCIFRTNDVDMASVHNVLLQKKNEYNAPYDFLRFNHYRALGWKGRQDEYFAKQVENKDILKVFS